MCKEDFIRDFILSKGENFSNMTLTDIPQDMNCNNIDQSAFEAGQTLKDIIHTAEQEHRIVNGIHKCALHLQQCPESVTACILADYGPTHDVAINIEHTLLEAYCMENYIPVLKVDSSTKIGKYINKIQNKNEKKYSDRSGDYTCLLIMKNSKADSKKSDTLLKFDKLYKVWGWHVIEFPI